MTTTRPRRGKTLPVVLACLAGVAFACALWKVDFSSDRWELVCALAFSSDGQTLAAGRYDGKQFNEDFHWCISDIGRTVVVFDAATGREARVVQSTCDRDTSWNLPTYACGQFLAYSPDGRGLAVGTWGGTISLWDATATRLQRTLAGPDQLTSLGFSPDGRTFAAADRHELILWDTADWGDGRQLFPSATIRSLAFSPREQTIALGCGHDGGARLWDIARGQETRVVPEQACSVQALRYHPDGVMLALGGDESTMLYDLQADRKAWEFKERWTDSVAFSPDGSTVATACQDGLHFRDAKTGKPQYPFRPTGGIRSVAYSPDGRLLATGDDSAGGEVWDLTTGKQKWSAYVSGPSKGKPTAVACVLVGVGLSAISGLIYWKRGL